MLRPCLHPLSVALALALAAPAVAATPGQPGAMPACRAPEALPPFRPALPAGTRAARATSPLVIEAERLNVAGEVETVFADKVTLVRADQWLGTEELRYQHQTETWTSPGPLRFEDSSLRMTAATGRGETAQDRFELREVQYQLTATRPGNGIASSAHRDGQHSTLTDATYSSCPPGERQWEFRAATLEVDDATGMGVAQNATLRIGGMPLLWLPWVAFPTTDERRSGLLVPTLGHDDDRGLDFTLPYYLNLAPNLDATLSPRWMSRRGLMLGGEFRYLTARSTGIFTGNWLPNDRIADRDRSFLSWQHFTALTPQWYANAHLQDVSDRRYFRDFGRGYGQNVLSLLTSTAMLAGRGRHWSTHLSVERWQAANPVVLPGSEPFDRLPRLRATLDQPLGRWLEASVDVELVRFDHAERAGGNRVDVLPRVQALFGGPSWFITPELGFRYTGYSLDRDPLAPLRERNPSRSLPIASLDMGLVFERDLASFGGAYLQTLEPRLYYLRVPYREQSALPLFDTQALSFSWPGLFRQNRYTGADRQSDAHQATLALTTRLLGTEDGRERLSASLGRVVYFDEPRVRLPGEAHRNDDGSAYVGELDWQISDAWSLNATQQWVPNAPGTDLSAVRTQYRFSERGLVNASYRYRRDLLEQADISFTAPISAHWRAVGRWVWSLRDRDTLDALGGVEWRSCCMAVRVLARDYIRDFGAERNLGVYFEIELTGIGSFGRDSERLLSDAILDYPP